MGQTSAKFEHLPDEGSDLPEQVQSTVPAPAPLKEAVQHGDKVNAIAYSPDGRFIASGGEDNKVVVRDAASREVVREHQHEDAVNAIAWSPDSRLIASGGKDNRVVVREVASGDVVHELQHHGGSARLPGRKGSVTVIAWTRFGSPAGSLIASGGTDNKVVVCEAASGKVMHEYQHGKDRLANCEGEVHSIAFSPNGRHIASGASDAKVRDAALKRVAMPHVYVCVRAGGDTRRRTW